MSPAKKLAADLALRARTLRQLLHSQLTEQRRQGRGPLLELRESCATAHAGTALAQEGEEAFADACAQTLTCGLLAARWLSRHQPGPFTLHAHPLPALLEQLLALCREPRLQQPLEELTRLLEHTPVGALFPRDPLRSCYEDFLEAYDPKLRATLGVYSTPEEVVSCMVRTTHELLKQDFGLPLGLADTTSWGDFAAAHGLQVPEGTHPEEPFVRILDPATGTGTFLEHVVRVIQEELEARWSAEGLGAEARRARWVEYVRQGLLPRVAGYELAMAPYAVAHLRLGLLLRESGFTLGASDRLELSLTHALAPERRAAFSVLLGNPPYDRVESGEETWEGGQALLEDYLEPARRAGAGPHLKNLYNLYVYFIRQATWQVFEARKAPGIVCLITPSSYLRGPGFVGLREHLRRLATRLHVLDLEGDRRGTRATDNVFEINTPVAILTLARGPRAGAGRPRLAYHRVEGDREAKLAFCARLVELEQVPWQDMPQEPRAPLLGREGSTWARWPALTDLFPWQHSGVQYKRTWPIAPTREVLRARWEALLAAEDRAQAFKETETWRVERAYAPLLPGEPIAPPLAELAPGAPLPRVELYAFRSFDRQWALVDARLGDRMRAPLWQCSGPGQLYMTSLLSGVLGPGPAATVSAHVPDLHHFRGSFGGKDVIPLWRNPSRREPNVCAGVLEVLRRQGLAGVEGVHLFAYAYAVLAHPRYVQRFSEELRSPGPRLPLTKDARLFMHGAELGLALLRLHAREGAPPPGQARCTAPVVGCPERHRYDEATRTLVVGAGRFAPVAPEVWRFSVSGLQVVKSWLDYRMKGGAGRRSSPLDDIRPEAWTEEMIRELLELLWVLEATLARYPELDEFLERVLAGELWTEAELPRPTEAERKQPRTGTSREW